MPTLSLVPPEILKEILLKFAYEIVDQDEYSWVLKRGSEPPLILSKKGHLVTREIMEKALHQAKMDNAKFFKFLKEIAPQLAPSMTVE